MISYLFSILKNLQGMSVYVIRKRSGTQALGPDVLARILTLSFKSCMTLGKSFHPFFAQFLHSEQGIIIVSDLLLSG